MPKIFICYRHEDSEFPAHHIYNSLTAHFGEGSVVFDVHIPSGVDIREYIHSQIHQCDVMLVLIGNQWLEILTNRLEEPHDFVRIEIETALKKPMPVIPVLVGRASMPAEKNLPPALSDLAFKRASEVRAGSDLETHLQRIRSRSATKLYDRRGYNPEKSASFFANY